MTSPLNNFFTNNNNNNVNKTWRGRGIGIGSPKFKSMAPSSLFVSDSSLFTTTILNSFSPSIFLNSPLLTNFPSPIVGAFGGVNFDWGSGSNETHQQSAKDEILNNNFTFDEAPNVTTERWNLGEPKKPKNDMISNDQTDNKPVVLMNKAQKRAEDGYCWRKYGQKQVKGSANPRSYYKCSYPKCPTTKKVESSLEGRVIKIVYKGSHNHQMPQPGRGRSSVENCQNSAFDASAAQAQTVFSTFTPQTLTLTSSVSLDDDAELDQSFAMSNSGKDDENEPEAKRWKGENQGEVMSGYESRTVKEPRVIVQTNSEIDILFDGYRWRKYGQKAVKGNHNPRSYYKCTSTCCPVRKHVERASQDKRAVITTYEGKHNHDVPVAHGRSGSINAPVPIRPSAIPSQRNHSNNLKPFNNSTNASRPETLSPFTLQMLQSPGSFAFSGFGNSSETKEKPHDSKFLEAFLANYN